MFLREDSWVKIIIKPTFSEIFAFSSKPHHRHRVSGDWWRPGRLGYQLWSSFGWSSSIRRLQEIRQHSPVNCYQWNSVEQLNHESHFRYEQRHNGGEVKFCFDNTISTFNRKTIFFELLQEDPDNPISDGDAAIADLDGLSPEEFYDMKVQDILDIIHGVKNQMNKARQLQVRILKLPSRPKVNLALF